MTNPFIVILAGGLSHERDVSIRSGRRVAEELRDYGLHVEVRDVDESLIPYLKSTKPDAVWPILHGSIGEDGSVRDLLDLMGVPYVGTSAPGSRRAWHKAIAKSIISDAGFATADYTTLPQSLFRDLGAMTVLEQVFDRLGADVVVKPVHGGSALGVSEVHSLEELPGAMVSCFSYGDIALIEQYVSGTELAVSVVGNGDSAIALPAVEIVTDGPYDFDARYNPGRTEFFTPARLSDSVQADVAELALSAHRVLGLRDISRTDMIVREDGTPVFLEVNVAPGMTETSLLPLAVAASETSMEELYAQIALMPLNREN